MFGYAVLFRDYTLQSVFYCELTIPAYKRKLFVFANLLSRWCLSAHLHGCSYALDVGL